MKANQLLAALVIAGLGATAAFAGNQAQQTITYEVQAINELSVSSGTVGLVVNAATAGQAPNVATDSSTTYAITTNETGRKITGALNTAMPSGVTLSVNLQAPEVAGTSAGKQELGTTAVDLVNGIATLNQAGLGIAYELKATSAAGVVAQATKTVTFTITADAQ